jgi:hypothetical protein
MKALDAQRQSRRGESTVDRDRDGLCSATAPECWCSKSTNALGSGAHIFAKSLVSA